MTDFTILMLAIIACVTISNVTESYFKSKRPKDQT